MSEEIKKDEEAPKKRKTLSLKKSVVLGAKSSNDTNQFKVEVKRKRSAVSADKAKSDTHVADDDLAASASGLTDSERDKRLKVLKETEADRKLSSENAEKARAIAEKEAEELRERRLREAEEKAKEPKKPAVKEEEPTDVSEVEALIETQTKASVKPVSSNDKVTLSLSDRHKKNAPADSEKKEEKKKTRSVRGAEERRRAGKLTVTNALMESEMERVRSMAALKRDRIKKRRQEMGDQQREAEKIIRDVIVPEVITVQELANRMAERTADVVRELMKMGMLVTANETIDADTAELVVSEFGHKIKRVTEADVENILQELEADVEGEAAVFCAPVVTVMGHVDHGKTSLLDALRSADVVSGEAGGITQHIGAYRVALESGDNITFLDTPGHEAFTAMRSRGAKVTNLVILVVAADDGIKEQTVEAINHAKAAEVPIIVAVNKIDKPEADPARVKNELLMHDLVPEDMGGDIQVVEVSAKQRINLEGLQDAILLQAEMLELKANPDRSAVGIVVESFVDKGKGAIATVIVQKGTLRVGDIVIAGLSMGKVRAMVDDKGKRQEEAGPSVPVEIAGLDGAPEAGEKFYVVDTERQAREIIEYREKRTRDLKAASEHRGSLEHMFSKASGTGLKELPIIIKADVQGSAEAIVGSLDKIATDEVGVKVLHSAVGGITESDVILAQASNAMILGFNVRANNQAKELAQKEDVDIRYYSIIYNLVDDMKVILGGMLAPEIHEKFIGTAEIRQVFSVSKSGKVAGCFVTDGIIKRGAGVRLLRDNIVIHEGKLKTLKRFKDDVKEVNNNFECGMAFENYDDIKEGDVIEAFEVIEEQRTLD